MTDDKKQKSFQQVNVRAIVLDILIETQKLDNMSHVVFGNALKKYQYLDKRERSFITKLSQGTIEKRIYLDYLSLIHI